jgi:sodium/proline symporter
MVVYMGAMLVVGAIYIKKNKSADDYLLGGRALGPWVCAMSAEASDMSSWLLMGLPGVAYLTGIGEAFWTAAGLTIGTYINWLFVAKRLRSYTKVSGNAITLPDYFSNRFQENKRMLMVISAVFILVFFAIYIGSGFVAMGTLFSSLFGLDYTLMMLIGAGVIIAYSLLGGFLAVSTTDLIQGILMFFSLVILSIVGIVAVGGGEHMLANLSHIDGFLNIGGAVYDGVFTKYSALDIASILAWGLGYFGMPHILLRFMAIKSPKLIKKSRRIATGWVIIAFAASIFIGLLGRSYFGDALIPDGVQETVFSQLAITLLPALIAGIMVSGILASTMSTSDSQLLVTASALSKNFYKGIIKKQASDKQILRASKIAVLIAAAIGIGIALINSDTIFGIVSYAWAGFGATFGPLVILSLFWKRTTRWGALAGMIGGAGTVFVWKEVLNPAGGLLALPNVLPESFTNWTSTAFGGIFSIYELLPAFIISLICIVVFSLITKKPDPQIVEEFELAKKNANMA